MILDSTLPEVMRLSNIKRWGIIEMSRTQSVAEHSYNVAMISLEIAKNLFPEEIPDSILADVLFWALTHDLPEIITGDIPTPVKKYIDFKDMEKSLFPEHRKHESAAKSIIKTIVKAADYIDALQFAEKFCIDTRKYEIMRDIQKNMSEFLTKKGNESVACAMEKLDF